MAFVADNFVIDRISSGVFRRGDGFGVFAAVQLIPHGSARGFARRDERLFRAVVSQRLRGGRRVQCRGRLIRDDFLSVGVSAGKRLRRQNRRFPVNDETFLKRHGSAVGRGGNAVAVLVRPAQGNFAAGGTADSRAVAAARRRDASAADGNRAAGAAGAAANARAVCAARRRHASAVDSNRLARSVDAAANACGVVAACRRHASAVDGNNTA